MNYRSRSKAFGKNCTQIVGKVICFGGNYTVRIRHLGITKAPFFPYFLKLLTLYRYEKNTNNFYFHILT